MTPVQPGSARLGPTIPVHAARKKPENLAPGGVGGRAEGQKETRRGWGEGEGWIGSLGLVGAKYYIQNG